MAGKRASEKIKAKANKKNGEENGKVTKTKQPTKRKREDSRNKKKIVNGNDDNYERDVVVVPDSESESQKDDREGYENGEMAPDSENEVEGNGVEEEEEEVESLKIAKKKSNRKDDGKVKKNGKVNEAAHMYSFPMHRISRMIKSDDPDIRTTQEAVFLVNKASEKFLELFAKEGYANALFDKKKHVEYKHLSTVVGKRRRFDFLSDFVPEKVKAEDALAETSTANP